MKSSGFLIRSAVIRISTDAMIDTDSRRSSMILGMGTMSSTTMRMTPSAIATSPRITQFHTSLGEGRSLPTPGSVASTMDTIARHATAHANAHAALNPLCGAGTLMPAAEYSFSLLRRVRIEMPKMLAAWVRLPRQWVRVSRMSACSICATV